MSSSWSWPLCGNRHATAPVRFELFGDDIESIREFDADEQTSTGRLDSAEILLAEADLDPDGLVADYAGENDLVIDVDADCELATVRITADADPGAGPEQRADRADQVRPCGPRHVGRHVFRRLFR